MTRGELEALDAKYAELVRLRRARAAGDESDVQAALRALAARFPGALREIDVLPMDVLEDRALAVSRALAGQREPLAWMEAMSAFHAWMRVALALRRAAPDRSLASARAWALEAGVTIDDETLAALVRPADGRLVGAALRIVARERGTSVEALERELFVRARGRG